MYCKACIPEGLQGKLFNVKSKRCEHEGCTIQASYGFKTDRVSAMFLLLTLLLITTVYNSCQCWQELPKWRACSEVAVPQLRCSSL
jgi:hypothetical protein